MAGWRIHLVLRDVCESCEGMEFHCELTTMFLQLQSIRVDRDESDFRASIGLVLFWFNTVKEFEPCLAIPRIGIKYRPS